MTNATPQPLGQILLQRGLITPTQLATALEKQKLCGDRLGAILAGEGSLTYFTLYKAVAEHYQLPFVDLLLQPVEDGADSHHDVGDYLKYEAIPWKWEGDMAVIATTDPNFDCVAWAHKRYKNFRLVVTSPLDIRRTLEKRFGILFQHNSKTNLQRINPRQSAFNTLEPVQRAILFVLLFGGFYFAFHQPHHLFYFIVLAANIFYGTTLIFKLMLFRAGMRYRKTRALPADIPDHHLPYYTILVPLYKEAASMPRLLSALRALDYPKSKLDIKLIIEEDDQFTREAAERLHPESNFHIIRVPYSLPRTKPKACNYALHFARGEFVTIYDAEDAPEPMQLRKSVALMRASKEPLACVQGRLNYYNYSENWLTRLFAIEYGCWFDYLLWGLEKFRMPIPLGGTSNHISLKELRRLGDWDPYNVTEDADLGLRLASDGQRTQVLDSLTEEEAPLRLGAWFTQRARWIKGYMQTWLVHMRRPILLHRTLGAKGFWGFQLFVGGPTIMFLTSPLLWTMAIFWVVDSFQHGPVVNGLFYLCMINFALSIGIHIILAAQVVKDKKEWKNMGLAIICFPFYWILHSFASLRALWQLIFNPHRWDKTEHGLTALGSFPLTETTPTR